MSFEKKPLNAREFYFSQKSIAETNLVSNSLND